MQTNDEWVTGASIISIACVVLAPVFLSVPVQPVSMDLIVVLAAALPFEILGCYLFLVAIRMAPLSLTLPLLAFTPVFSIVTAAMILVEGISIQGGMGISLVTAGAYLLNANLVNHSVTAPIKAIFSNRGSRLMFLVALIWSVAATIGKRGVMVYGAIPFAFVILCAIAVVFFLVSFYRI
jgi:drug/metabolite transporter (DMT)-like permease